MKKLLLTFLLAFVASPVFAAHQVALTWNQTTDPVALNCVFRASSSGGQDPTKPLFCSTAPITSYTDLAVVGGDKWFYTTDAVSSKGVASPMSNEAPAVIPLQATSNLLATSQ